MSTAPAPPVVSIAGYLSLDDLDTPSGRFRAVPGGAALYAALGARAAGGVRVRLIARRANDYPDAVLAAVAALGIELDGIERAAGATRRARLLDCDAATGRATRRASPHHGDDDWWERTLALAPPERALSGAVAVLCAMPARTLAAHLGVAKARGMRVLVDTSEAFARRERDALLALLEGVDVFAPSTEEVRLLVPAPDAATSAEALARRCRVLVEKRGPHGLVWRQRGAPALRAASRARRVLDTTGAGDAAVGALAAALATGMPPAGALATAARVAALAVEAPGPSGLGLECALEEVA